MSMFSDKPMLKWLWLSVSLIVVDQITKQLAENVLTLYQTVAVMPFFNIVLVYNTGAAFSFLADASGWQRWFFLSLSIVISIVLLIWLGRLRSDQRLQAVALALILSGAIGNLVDRAIYGHVIDFLDVYYGQWHWPAFNVADSAITIGAILLIIDSLFNSASVSTKQIDQRTD